MIHFIKHLVTLKIVPCHRMKDRSIVINGWQFPVCSRCMTMLFGFLTIPFLFAFDIHLSMLIGYALNLPMIIDGYTQKWKWRQSNNFLRMVTGLLSGIGMSIIIVAVVRILVELLLNIK